MPACPGQILVISFCRGYDNPTPVGLYSYDVYLNNTIIGSLPGGLGNRSDIFIGNPLAILPSSHEKCSYTTIDLQNTFDDSIVSLGLNTIEIDVTGTTSGGPLNGGNLVVTRYNISSGGVLTNPVVLPFTDGNNGWWLVGGHYGLPFTFNYYCDIPPDIIFTTTTTPGPNPPPLTAYPCVCCCVEDDYVKLLPEKLIFTIPTTIISNNYSLSSVYIEDVTQLSYNIMTTTIIPTTTIKPSYTTINPITTYIPKQCKCGEVGCNALKF
jgi:hypothetical protein